MLNLLNWYQRVKKGSSAHQRGFSLAAGARPNTLISIFWQQATCFEYFSRPPRVFKILRNILAPKCDVLRPESTSDLYSRLPGRTACGARTFTPAADTLIRTRSCRESAGASNVATYDWPRILLNSCRNGSIDTGSRVPS